MVSCGDLDRMRFLVVCPLLRRLYPGKGRKQMRCIKNAVLEPSCLNRVLDAARWGAQSTTPL